MIKIYMAAILVGLALGPAYGVYCHYFSGEEIKTATMFELLEDRSRSSTNRVIAIPFKSETVTFRLTPDMNPIGLSLEAQLYQMSPSTLQKHLDFEAVLAGSDSVIWRDNHRLTWKQSKKKGADLNLSEVAKKIVGPELGRRATTVYSQLPGFEVQQPGDYALTMTQTGEKDAAIATIHITARRNVTLINTPVFIAGCILLLLAVIAFGRAYSKKTNTVKALSE